MGWPDLVSPQTTGDSKFPAYPVAEAGRVQGPVGAMQSIRVRPQALRVIGSSVQRSYHERRMKRVLLEVE